MTITAETAAKVTATLDDLSTARLPPATWHSLSSQLARLDRAFDAGDEHEARAALVPLSRAAFEAKVLSRHGARRPSAAVVAPTKRTPALPAVGAVCGGTLLFLGWQLGGGLVLGATAALALFVLAIAVAGTYANAERTAARQARNTKPEHRTGAPPDVATTLSRLRQR